MTDKWDEKALELVGPVGELWFIETDQSDAKAAELIAAALRAAVEEEREACRAIAKYAWVEAAIGMIADADAQCALSEWIADAIAARKAAP